MYFLEIDLDHFSRSCVLKDYDKCFETNSFLNYLHNKLFSKSNQHGQK